MKKDVLENLVGLVDENLPAILTGVGCTTGVATVGYSVYAGWKIRDILEDENLDIKAKFKKGMLMTVPILAGSAASIALIVAANKEYGKRYAALGALLVANKTDVKEISTEALDKLGLSDKEDKKKKTEKESTTKQQKTPYANGDVNVEIRDDITGYVFQTTLNEFWYTVGVFNETIPEDGTLGMDDFYRMLLKDRYDEVAAHSYIRFGAEDCPFDSESSVATKVFSPQLGSEITGQMMLRYTIFYDHN